MRLHRVTAWLEKHDPDVVCLQETKVPDEQFPAAELEACGYQVAYTGEKGLNGVALIVKQGLDLSDVQAVLPGKEDDTQKRFISALIDGVRVIDVYVPNGKGVGTEDFFFKLDWLSRLVAHLKQSHDPSQPLALLGDFNIAPTKLDVADPTAWENRLHCTDHERRMISFLEDWGLQDSLRLKHPAAAMYSWFDYRTSRPVKQGDGLRIDLILVTEPLAERLLDVSIDLEERQGEKPSDHAPVIAEFRAQS